MWDSQTGACLRILEGHTDAVWGVQALADGRLLSWSGDKTLRLWDSQTGACLRILGGHTDMVWGAQALADGRLLSWSWDKTLRLWDSQRGECLASLIGHTGHVLGALILTDGHLLSWGDKTLRLWDGQSGRCVATFEGHTKQIWGAMALADGRLLSWSQEHLRLWDMESGVCLEVVHERDVRRFRPEWSLARTTATDCSCATGNFYIESFSFYTQSFSRTAWLRHGALPVAVALWEADADTAARCLLPDGTAVVTLRSGQVCILKLHYGHRRVSFAEAEELLRKGRSQKSEVRGQMAGTSAEAEVSPPSITTQPMTATWKTVRVFISSTFRDMQSERDWLVRFVFPKLRQELLQRRIHLVDVDLRWGVTSEQDALSVCREVVDECRPRFLCMLGGRYGWVPPGKTRSITADEVHYGVLDRDLKSRGFAFFYFRDPSATAVMVEVAPGEFREPAGSHGAVALAELKTAISEAGLQPFIYRAQWDDQSRRLIGLKKFGDRVCADLKQSIDQEFGPTTGEKPDEFTEENAAMEAFIEERVQRFVLGSRQAVWNELRHHAESTGGNGYLCLTGEAGSGKSALLAHFYRALTGSLQRSAETAKAFATPAPFRGQPALVICHFVGASPGSTDVRRTLRRLCHELVTGAELAAEIPEDPEKLRVAFAELLQQASARKRVVILLDAINQFDSTTHLADWSWLPEELPATARVILSTLVGPRSTRNTRKEAAEEARGQRAVISDQSSVVSDQQAVLSPQSLVISPIDALRHRRHPPREIELKPLTVEDAEAIIREFLHRYRKSMTDDQRAALLAKADAGTPLYLLVALEELRTLGTYEEITGRIAQLPPDTRALFTWILKRLEDDDGFRDASGRKIGRELVSRFVSLMGASRHGLSPQELVELLSPGDPQGNVAALAQLLRPYLMQRGELLDFYHGQFREATTTAYLPTGSQRLAAHDQLATYFREQADPEKNQSWKGNSPRPFLEVAFHLVGAQRTDDYCQTLCDLRFVEARCRLGQVFELIADYRLAQENLPESQAEVAEERRRKERAAKWTREIIEYARQWNDRLDRFARGESVTEPEPSLPEIIPLVEPWSSERIEMECKRIIEDPTRLDRLHAFVGFVKSECYPLLAHGKHAGFVVPHAFNTAPAGPVHDEAARLRSTTNEPLLLRRWPASAAYNPRPALLRTLEGHSSIVHSVSVTSGGRRAVSGSGDHTLRLWDLVSGACLGTLKGHRNNVSSVSVTPDGRRAVSGSWDKTLRVWDLESGACLRTLKGHKGWFESVSVTPNGRRAVSGSGTRDKTLRVWDLESGACLRTLAGHSDGVESVSVTPDGRCAVSGSSDHTLRIWDLESGACLRTLAGHSAQVLSVSVTPDGRRAVSGSSDQTLRVWDLERGACLRILEGHSERVWSVSVTPDGRRAVSGSYDKTLRVWDLESGACLRILEGHSDGVESVSVTPDGRCAVSGAHHHDTALRVWNLENGACLRNFAGHSESVRSVCVTPDGGRAVSGSYDKTLGVWDTGERGVLADARRRLHYVQCVRSTRRSACGLGGAE